MDGGLSPSRLSGVKEEGEEHPGVDAAQMGAAVQGGEEAAGARKRTQQERSPTRAGMASLKLRKADDVTRAGGTRGEEEEGCEPTVPQFLRVFSTSQAARTSRVECPDWC